MTIDSRDYEAGEELTTVEAIKWMLDGGMCRPRGRGTVSVFARDKDGFYSAKDKCRRTASCEFPDSDSKPEGMVAELADVWIYCQIFGGALGIDLEYGDPDSGVWHIACSQLIETARRCDLVGYRDALVEMMAIAHELSEDTIDKFHLDEVGGAPSNFLEAVAMKHEFNKIRPRMHGKKA
jgi:hypothetical protein